MGFKFGNFPWRNIWRYMGIFRGTRRYIKEFGERAFRVVGSEFLGPGFSRCSLLLQESNRVGSAWR